MALKWEVQEDGVAKMLQEPGVVAFLSDVARQGLAKAVASAPVNTGSYRDSLTMTDARVEDGVAVVGFGSSSWHWHFVEFGTSTNPPFRVLGDAVETVADKVQHL